MYRISDLDDFLRRCDEVEANVESRLWEDSDVDLLETIPGVGRQTAVQLMSMIVDVDRFGDAEHMCAYFGMVPKVRD